MHWAKNIEIKLKVDDIDDLVSRAAEIADNSEPILLVQKDIFFSVPFGRLKLRSESINGHELILYFRPNSLLGKRSKYLRVPVPSHHKIYFLLKRLLGVRGVVKKERRLFLAGRNRIHLDNVEGLGYFLEIEIVQTRGDLKSSGHQHLNHLVESVADKSGSVVAGSYIDLICDTRQKNARSKPLESTL